ncbi:MAG: DUF3450 family protein [Phycisphaerales bacterium]
MKKRAESFPDQRPRGGGVGRLLFAALLASIMGFVPCFDVIADDAGTAGPASADSVPADSAPPAAEKSPPPPTLEQTRVTMGAWLDTQQIISKERKDWQQGKEILLGRLELIKKELADVDESIQAAQAEIAQTEKERNKLLAENQQFVDTGTQLTHTIAGMESEVRRLSKTLPEPVRTKLQPLYQRIPDDSAKTRASVAERFQNVLGILNELNKANTEITVSYEVHNLADGRPSEVKAIYLGLAQAYYVSARGEAGIGQPAADGWKWEPSQSIARDVLAALEMIQGKQTPAFVPLPVTLQ